MIDLDSLEKEIKEKFPSILEIRIKKNHLRLLVKEDITLDINIKKYPKRPKAKLERNDGKIFNLYRTISSLRDWDKKNAPTILELIDEILLLIKSMISNQILIKKRLITGLMEMCRENHPKKVKGILSVEKGIVSEYILPSRACTDSKRDINVWSLSSCSIPLNFTYQGTFISRPSGDLSKNDKLNEVFKKRRFTLLIKYPYDGLSHIKCFGTYGETLNVSIVE